MAKRGASESQWADPNPYFGPIQRADGRRPYNHYLWPMAGDSWWVTDPLARRLVHPNHIAIIGLADGRWSTSGSIHSIEENRDCYGHSPCVFGSREEALRAAVARFIRTVRRARHWPDKPLRPDASAEAVNWALDIVCRPHVRVPPPPAPRPARTGLPLFDIEAAHA